jgi:ribosomal protein S18 acetylase RimI-like enzyme
MSEAGARAPITVRPAVPEDAEGIARTFAESAAHHAQLDPERYYVPATEMIQDRYREGRQHLSRPAGEAITFVADLAGEIAGFVDARLESSPDAMHRGMIYCYIAEIAVSLRHQRKGIGQRLLRAAEEWGREGGASIACLEYHVANTRAAAFYQERMGYRVASITANKWLVAR